MISRNMYKTGDVLMALVTAFTVTGLSGCKSRTVSNEVTAEYDTPDDYNDERPGVTYGNVDEISYYSPTTGSERKVCVYLPRDYDESQSYPVVYLLHGMSGSYSEYNRIGALYVAQNAVDDYNRNPVIMVSLLYSQMLMVVRSQTMISLNLQQNMMRVSMMLLIL